MIINKFLSELTLNDLNLTHLVENYQVKINPDSTVGSIIYEHLNSKPGFIKHKRSLDNKKELSELYSKAIHKTVSKGAPLEIFISAFSPKITNPDITNGYIYPDMSDLLTLIHLHSVAKGIREVYDYGFRFIIGYRGNVYKEFFNWNDEEVKACYEHLLSLTKVAEKIVGVRNVIRFVDTVELIEEEGDDFQQRLEEEIRKVETKFNEGDAFYVRKINAWINDFKHAIDASRFKNEEEMNAFLFSYGVRFRALKNIEYTGGKHDLGICNSFPNILLATIRGLDEKISFQLNPFFRFHSHQRLIALKKDGTWETMKWMDMQESEIIFEPVYYENLDYPFYFIER